MVSPVRTVSYSGTDPDPVEWANEDVKPALDSLDLRVGAPARGLIYRSVFGQRGFQPVAGFDSSTTYTTQNVLGLFQFIAAAPLTFVDLVFDVGAVGASGQYRWGIYNTDLKTGMPSTLAFATSMAGTMGAGLAATAAAFTIPQGVYWGGWAIQAPSGSLRRMITTCKTPESLFGMSGWLGGASDGYNPEVLTTAASGTLPADLTGATFGLTDWHAAWTLRSPT